jgi:hypothetical protein
MAQNKKISKQSIEGIAGDLTFSKKNVWLWVKLPPAQFEFQDYDARVSAARQMDYTLANLLTSDDKALECHLLVSSRPFNSRQWVEEVYDRSQQDTPAPYLPTFLKQMHARVRRFEFREKLVLLGINLGARTEYASVGSVIPLGAVSNYFSSLFGVVDEYMSDKEIDFWDHRAQAFRASLASSQLHAEPVYAEELAFVIRKNFYPAMPSPDYDDLSTGNKEKWGEGEIAALFDAEIENRPRWLKICQMVDDQERIGYRATLSFARFPETLRYPEKFPWIHNASLLPFNTDFSSRFTLEPSRKVRKEVGRKNREAQDQARNQTSAGGNVTMDVAENLMKAEELDYFLSKSNEPWLFGRHRITVEAETEDELKQRVRQVIEHYRNSDIFVVWSTGDQMNLLMEGLPNDQVRVSSYYQHHQLSIISAGVPTGAGSVGDYVSRDAQGVAQGWLGPYLGYTTGSTREPVFMSVHSAIARNNPPGLVITGSPGGGKSFSAFTLTYQMALQGIWTIYIDPKGDAEPMVRLPGLEQARLLDLRKGNAGILDPFSIGEDKPTQKQMALETIELLMGGREAITHRQLNALARVLQAVAIQPQPSRNKVVDALLQSDDPEAESLGQNLKLLSELPFARLAFAPKGQHAIRPDQGLTIITLLGLDLPSASASYKTYSNSNRLAVAIMYLLTSFTRQLMMNLDKSHKKAIVIDEAWAVTSTNQGKKIVEEVARMGRSLNTGLVLVSQNAGDFSGDAVLNSVSTRLAFRAKTREEIEQVLTFYELEHNEGNYDTIRNLKNGECLMKDAEGRISTVKIDAWNQNMKQAFDTNPNTRGKTDSA